MAPCRRSGLGTAQAIAGLPRFRRVAARIPEEHAAACLAVKNLFKMILPGKVLPALRPNAHLARRAFALRGVATRLSDRGALGLTQAIVGAKQGVLDPRAKLFPLPLQTRDGSRALGREPRCMGALRLQSLPCRAFLRLRCP